MDFSKIRNILSSLIPANKRVGIIVLAGLAGMTLIALPAFFKSKDETKEVQASSTPEASSADYARQLEQELTALVSKIEGVGRVQVMVTLEGGVEYVYAQEQKRNTDKTQEITGEQQVGKTYQKENIEEKYILVESEYGKKQPLILRQLQPKVQGVVILCEGAGNIRVEQVLTQVVTTALPVGSNKVCIAQIISE
ncbi:hypothetical protein U6B65_03200 [Oscillospiraceae bacterium MB08-C2-2]|nr:hypothetical protein U6B65_03200 [Oscillospiraceae bacterium MB08-C2-2]